ncbi:alpha-galactosidase [Actinoalloteichus fjordicus]|uniref:alpha-galactosidase n=1 Tax=Actinoalloteichus fjordicus TaxID=1612552 RepID=A0AAC9LG55_9PSEU|nr:alpha-galactosidase [Actinoalloteichus fjordicus]APU15730.1 alpha-galactosidase [Actinoalloteichus fjordicus]
MPLPPADSAPLVPADGSGPETAGTTEAAVADAPETSEIVVSSEFDESPASGPGPVASSPTSDAADAAVSAGTVAPASPAALTEAAEATERAGAVLGASSPIAPLVHLRAAGVSLVLDIADRRLPSVLHWGADLGTVSAEMLAELCRASTPAPALNDLDEIQVIGVDVLPEHAAGWRGRPGLTGQRDGRGWSPLFERTALDVETRPANGGRVVADGLDAENGLTIRVEIELLPTGLLRQRAGVTAIASPSLPAQPLGTPYAVDGLALALPVPPVATELFDLAGRWGRERAPQRAPFVVGSHTRENRRGRTGADAPLILAAGTEGFDFRSGEVWAVHVAWSGNHLTYAERLADGTAVLGGGELLAAGEVRLAAGESYLGPWLYAAYGVGFDGVAARFHEHLRSRPHHPHSPRPVVLNTWEAVYFDHDLDRLVELARRGAEAGVERYVLDDGWFRHRRNSRAGLGDWYVDPDVWPDGLNPLIEQVRALGMEFGLWFEPEMVNPDSDLARAHPDWILGIGDRPPLLSRNQLVLDLGNPEVFDYLLERLDSLLSEYDISYVKWDHNRDLVDAGRPPTGRAGVHQQTLAVYRLLDELRSRHPDVEIESCSSGGLRIDLGILERTDRVWGSDVIDPLERQQIQRWTSQLLPPELVGSHVGAPRSHTTARTHSLSFRAGTALFGSFGIEWNLTSASAQELAELAEWVALYKRVRQLLHTGTLVRAEQHDPSFAVHGVVARDGGDALFALVQLATPLTSIPGSIRLPGLDPERDYDVSVQPPGDRPSLRQSSTTPWIEGGVRLTGRVLDHVGLRAPALHPEQLLLIRVRAVTS